MKLNNINIKEKMALTPPNKIFDEMPISIKMRDEIIKNRKTVEDIINGKILNKFILIVGPCSIHNLDEALDYAKKLAVLKEKVKDKLFIIMRVYFEKPRTRVGWKGMIYDPDLNDSYNFEKGIRLARKLMLEINNIGIPVATELLDPIITQYISGLICWAAIGARTTESQPHRQMVSGISMPVGFKNATNGNIDVAIDAVKSASSEHSFLGVLEDGMTGVFRTTGNKNCHIILRGGKNSPNYNSPYIAFTTELLKKENLNPAIIVDCSHDNSLKIYKNQIDVFENIVQQKIDGNRSIIGAMLESNLFEGSQKIVCKEQLKYGISITDSCIGWEDTERIILDCHKKL